MRNCRMSNGVFIKYVYPFNSNNHYIEAIYLNNSIYIDNIYNYTTIYKYYNYSNLSIDEDINTYYKNLITLELCDNVSNKDKIDDKHLILKINNSIKEIVELLNKLLQFNNEQKQTEKRFNIIKELKILFKVDIENRLYLILITNLEINKHFFETKIIKDANNIVNVNINDSLIISNNKNSCEYETVYTSKNIENVNLITKNKTNSKQKYSLYNYNKFSPLKVTNENFDNIFNSNFNYSIPNKNKLKNNNASVLSPFINNKNNNKLLCKSCNLYVHKELLYSISYEHIILNHEYKCKTNGFHEIIPPILTKIIDNININMYEKLKKFDKWIKHLVILCNDCYLKNTC